MTSFVIKYPNGQEHTFRNMETFAKEITECCGRNCMVKHTIISERYESVTVILTYKINEY